MAKLTAAFVVLLAALFGGSASAQEQQPGTPMPLMTICSMIPPERTLTEKYGEIPFVAGEGGIFIPSGQMVNGLITLYLNPDGSTFTIMLTVSEEVHCMLVTGKDLKPVIQGDDL